MRKSISLRYKNQIMVFPPRIIGMVVSMVSRAVVVTAAAAEVATMALAVVDGVALNECKNYQEINAQLKIELRRMVVIFEQTNKNSNNTQHDNNGNNQNNPNNNQNNSSSGAAAAAAALMAAATQNAKAELLQARLTESELRYHTVTESLSRQTGVLTDQHRAILELSTQLETERATRQAIEFELQQQLVSNNTTTTTANTATTPTNHAGGVSIQQ